MRILITGAGGQLATALARSLQRHDLTSLSHQQLDITYGDEVQAAVSGFRPDLVVNTAAFHRVDDCEEMPERAFAVNALGPRHLALACAAAGAALLHVSTDYVFDGAKNEPYLETDEPAPINVYGASKLAGERFVRLLPKHYVVRTSGLFGVASSGKAHNFVATMLRLARAQTDARPGDGPEITVVDDQRFSPTGAPDLADAIARLIDSGAYGLYHVTNSGDCSWFEFAAAIFEDAGLSPRLSRTSSEAYGARARRPACSVLASAALPALGLGELPHWREALRAYLRQINATQSANAAPTRGSGRR
jgi:dTDP-4-dehydrorhamnose reductase